MCRLAAAMALVGSLVLLSPLASAAADSDPEARLKSLERSAEETRQNNARLETQAAALAGELAKLQADSVAAATTAQGLESAVSDLEAELQALSVDEQAKATALADSRARQQQLLQALQRLALNPPEAMLFMPGNPVDRARGAMLLSAAAPEIDRQAKQLAVEIDDLAFVRTSIDRKRNELLAKTASLDVERRRIAGLIKRKGELQDQARQGAEQQSKRLVALTSQANDIKDLIQRLEQEQRERQARAEQRQAELKAAAEERARAEAVARARVLAEIQARDAAERALTEQQNKAQLAAEATARSAAEAGKQALVPVPAAAPAAPSSAAAQTQIAAAPVDQQPRATPPSKAADSATPVAARPLQLGQPKETRPFETAARGAMLYPVAGRVTRRYGEEDAFGGSAKGLSIGTRAGAQVVAPFDGQIMFAGPFKGYGQILIIDHGGGYHSLLAGMDEIDGVVNQWVVAGEPVGSMGADSQTPSLYLELRRQGQPINPLPWLAARAGKVSG
ncbi:MAG TPA: peptidoglycan DD-metalloendopeptidase family protein [Stellaceae bacterium]|nr:peptidoglycan DD-metalloendopeptidase family protein [Stellaceae bacterium]